MKIWKAEDILAYRAEHNLTQPQMAELIGVDISAISHWERSARTPRLINQFKLNQLEKKKASK